MKLVLRIGKDRHEKLREMAGERERSMTDLVKQLIDLELTSWDATRWQRTPKDEKAKRSVGRPRISEEEKKGRDRMALLEQMYLLTLRDRLHANTPEFYVTYLQPQWEQVQHAAAEHDWEFVKRFWQAQPWRNPKGEDGKANLFKEEAHEERVGS